VKTHIICVVDHFPYSFSKHLSFQGFKNPIKTSPFFFIQVFRSSTAETFRAAGQVHRTIPALAHPLPGPTWRRWSTGKHDGKNGGLRFMWSPREINVSNTLWLLNIAMEAMAHRNQMVYLMFT
jgi:hypothetical protein